MILTLNPSNFNPSLKTAGVFVFVDKKVLLVKRAPGKSHAGKWGSPGGKQEGSETLIETACRELFEETGIQLNDKDLHLTHEYPIRGESLDYTFACYQCSLADFPSIHLKLDEHTDYGWFTKDQVYDLPFMGHRDFLDDIFARLNIS